MNPKLTPKQKRIWDRLDGVTFTRVGVLNRELNARCGDSLELMRKRGLVRRQGDGYDKAWRRSKI